MADGQVKPEIQAEKPQCGTCAFFDGVRCKRRSPQIVVIERTIYSEWPKPNEHDWCGEWKNRDEVT